MKKVVSLVLTVVFALFLSFSAYAEKGDTIVYRTRTGEKYHDYGCQYLSQSCIETTLADAVAAGLTRCSKCHPPRLDASPTPEPSLSLSQEFTESYREKYGAPSSSYKFTHNPSPTPTSKANTEMTPGLYLFIAVFIGYPVFMLAVGLYLYVIQPIVREIMWRKEVARKAEEYRKQQERLRQIEKEYLERHKNGLF